MSGAVVSVAARRSAAWALLIGLFGGGDAAARAGLIGGGAVACSSPSRFFSPHLVRPLAAVVGAPLERLGGLTGRLARENAQRNPAAPRSPRRR